MSRSFLFLLVSGILTPSLLFAQAVKPSKTASVQSTDHFDITPFGSIRSWTAAADRLGQATDYARFNANQTVDTADIGVFWWNPRDIESMQLVQQQEPKQNDVLPVVQYWQDSWPEAPPRMPSTEDLEDDPWQGRWITASTDVKIKGTTLVYSFKPLTEQENAHAGYLPGKITYRRTLKLRFVYNGKHQPLRSLHIFSVSKEKNKTIRIELTATHFKTPLIEGRLEVFNGALGDLSGWRWNNTDKKTSAGSFSINRNGNTKGIIATIYAAAEGLPGSNDETVVTVRSTEGNYSFSMNDVEKGPVYIPSFNAYITEASDLVSFSASNVKKGKTIRERIPEEQEQTYDRASKEIPALDPTHRSGGGNIDLPLAADASWQKFAVQWGGNILIDKEQAKAQGKELLRCNWQGSHILWNIGTGKDPVFRRTTENCRMAMMDDYLPVVQAAWHQGTMLYKEEAFVTLLKGPLSPEDANRDEQTPAILMVKLTVSNPALNADTSHLWLAANKGLSDMSKDGDFLMDKVDGKNYIRSFMPPLPGKVEKMELLKDSASSFGIIHRQIMVGPNSSETIYCYFPFVGDLTSANRQEMAALNYNSQKNAVVNYWRTVVEKNSVFNVPERKFNEMSRAVIPHIRMSVTKDPKSGLYMVPAAAFSYKVYPNESIFQTMLLDRMGDFKMSGQYLNTFMKLQGSAKLPGTFTGDQKDVFYGLRYDSIYDMTESNGYNMHHGTTLWGLAMHYLYSGDKDWLLKAAPHMIRAFNWIVGQRSNTKLLDERGRPVPHYGLLPAGVLEDVHDWQFWYATNAYACLGMETMASAFEKAGLPQADSLKAAAQQYHDDIRRSIVQSVEESPVVRLRDNTYVPYVPSRPYQRFRYFGSRKSEYYSRYQQNIHPNMRLSAIREALYGPVVLLKAGLIDADEPMAGWVLDDWEDNITLSTSLNLNVHGWVDDQYWFSRGGMVFQANLQNPVGIYLARNEIPASIRGLYDNFVSCLYPDVNAQTEEYHEWGHGSGPFYKCPDEARLISQVCDLLVVEEKDELWLAAGVPRRWLGPGQNIRLNKAQTRYGEVSYLLAPGELPATIEADIRLPQTQCSRILLYVRAPFQKPIKKVIVNGQEWKEWNAEKEYVVIPQTAKNVHVSISY